ncbi:cell division protein FtsQ [alpha proteobacterium U9-1i]|nr:cell division protein FtsQ [alpha proteobacterium U9-1i]
MSTMRARRPGRSAAEPTRKGRGRRTPPPPPSGENMPRLARIKLSGGLAPDEVQVSGKSLGIALAGILIFGGAAIAGAAWMGSSLFDVREAAARTVDVAAADVGFRIDEVKILGVAGARAQEVREQIIPDGRQSILSLDPADVKARIEALDWVAHAYVRRLWPSTMEIRVERRQAYARWQEGDEITVIDANGDRLLAEQAADHPELPLVIGANAGPTAEPLLLALEELPEVRERLSSLVRVRDRRWNMELTNGMTIALPEAEPAIALSRLEGLQTQHRLLDRPIATIDMRAPGRMSVRVRQQLTGGNSPLAEGV